MPNTTKKVDKIKDLTASQKRVAVLLAIGHTNHEISKELKCSVKTVDSHRGAVMARLGERNNVTLARRALREGLVDLDGRIDFDVLELDCTDVEITPPEAA